MKLLKARPLVNNFFPLFDFFFHLTRCRRREVGNYSFPPSLSTTFFSFRKILFSEPFVSPSSRRSLCACQTLARRSLSATARREKRLWTLSRQRSRSFFNFFLFLFLFHDLNMLKGGFLDASSTPNLLFSRSYRGMRRALACFRCRAVQKRGLRRRAQPLVSLTNWPTRKAESTVPSRSPTISPRTASASAAALMTRVISKRI